MAEVLNPQGTPVELHPGIVIRTPGLTGTAEVYVAVSEGTRAADGVKPDLAAALAANEISEDFTIEIQEPRELDTGTGSRAVAGDDAIELEVANPGEAYGQIVFYMSENEAVSWHFPEGTDGDQPTVRGSSSLTYRIPRAVTPTPDTVGQRGLAGAAGKKILKVLTFKLIREGAKWVGRRFAEHLENKHRPHRLHLVKPGRDGPLLADAPTTLLKSWAGARTLLLVHGTFSSTAGCFATFPHNTLQDLHTRYDGRVLAFDHPTISRSPVDNARWLGDRLRANGIHLDVDLITHSRGGLVGRVLAENTNLGATADALAVHRAALVACPNAGTALAAVGKHSAMVDRISNLLQLFPDNGVTDVLEVAIAVLKQIAVGVVDGLPGLTSMDPQGPFLTQSLNAGPGPTATYFAAGSNFEPAEGSPLHQIAFDAGADIVFGGTTNDLVVPRDGTHHVPGANGFSIANPLLFDSPAIVHHSGYWKRPEMNAALLDWLTRP